MSDISPLSSGSSLRVEQAARAYSRTAESAAPTDTPRRGTDQVEVSSVASYLSKLRDLPIRQDLVDRVRSEIASGTYETPDKLDSAISEIGKDLA